MGDWLYALIEHRSGRGGTLRNALGVVVVRPGDELVCRTLDVPDVVGADSTRVGMAVRAIVARLRRENPQTLRELELFAAKEANEVGLSPPHHFASPLSADNVADLFFHEKVRPRDGKRRFPCEVEFVPPTRTSQRAVAAVEMCSSAESIAASLPDLPSFEFGASTFVCAVGAVTTFSCPYAEPVVEEAVVRVEVHESVPEIVRTAA